MPPSRPRRQRSLPADSDPADEQPSKRVFLSFPDDWNEMSEEERLEMTGQMADIMIRALGLDEMNE